MLKPPPPPPNTYAQELLAQHVGHHPPRRLAQPPLRLWRPGALRPPQLGPEVVQLQPHWRQQWRPADAHRYVDQMARETERLEIVTDSLPHIHPPMSDLDINEGGYTQLSKSQGGIKFSGYKW